VLAKGAPPLVWLQRHGGVSSWAVKCRQKSAHGWAHIWMPYLKAILAVELGIDTKRIPRRHLGWLEAGQGSRRQWREGVLSVPFLKEYRMIVEDTRGHARRFGSNDTRKYRRCGLFAAESLLKGQKRKKHCASNHQWAGRCGKFPGQSSHFNLNSTLRRRLGAT